MLTRVIFLLLVSLLLPACSWNPPSPSISTPSVQPSHTPLILLPTAVITLPTLPSTSTTTLTPEIPSPSPDPTSSPTVSLTPLPPLTAEIIACETSLDITHGMGEVTDVFIRLLNYSSQDFTNLCAVLSADDEGRQHPDKSICLPQFPTKHQILLKLTVDTTSQVNTAIRVDVSSHQGYSASASLDRCLDVGFFRGSPEDLGMIKPIP